MLRIYLDNAESEELLVKDYTEWRRAQSFYNDPDMNETLEYFKKHQEPSWYRDSDGKKVFDKT